MFTYHFDKDDGDLHNMLGNVWRVSGSDSDFWNQTPSCINEATLKDQAVVWL